MYSNLVKRIHNNGQRLFRRQQQLQAISAFGFDQLRYNLPNLASISARSNFTFTNYNHFTKLKYLNYPFNYRPHLRISSSSSPTLLFHTSSVDCAKPKDYYDVLGVSRNASIKDIKRAYIELAKKYHPDANPGNQEAAKKFQEVADAYSVLSNKQKRDAFDASNQADGRADGGGGGQGFESVRRSSTSWTYQSPYESFHSSVDPEELFRKIFGQDFGPQFVNRSKRVWVDFADSGSEQTQETVVRLTFREAAKGCEKIIKASTLTICDKCFGIGSEPGRSIQLCTFCDGLGFEVFDGVSGKLRSTCRFCHGKGHNVVHKCSNCMGYGKTVVEREVILPVPAGISDGETVKVNIESSDNDQATAGSRVEHQSVFVVFRVEPSDYFTVDGYDLHTEACVSLSQAIFGGRILIDGLWSEETIDIKPGTDSHSIVKLVGKGLKKTTTFGYGDHYVHLKINVPKNLNEQQKELLKSYAKIETETFGEIKGIERKEEDISKKKQSERKFAAMDEDIDEQERIKQRKSSSSSSPSTTLNKINSLISTVLSTWKLYQTLLKLFRLLYSSLSSKFK